MLKKNRNLQAIYLVYNISNSSNCWEEIDGAAIANVRK